MEPRTRFELVTLACLIAYQGNALGCAQRIYQAEPPGHGAWSGARDLIKLSRTVDVNFEVEPAQILALHGKLSTLSSHACSVAASTRYLGPRP